MVSLRPLKNLRNLRSSPGSQHTASLIRGRLYGKADNFATLHYADKKKRTKRDVFLAEMAAAVRAGSSDRAALPE
jgi:hypothetical protein